MISKQLIEAGLKLGLTLQEMAKLLRYERKNVSQHASVLRRIGEQVGRWS